MFFTWNWSCQKQNCAKPQHFDNFFPILFYSSIKSCQKQNCAKLLHFHDFPSLFFSSIEKIAKNETLRFHELEFHDFDGGYSPFSFAVPRFSFDFQPLFVQPQLFFLCPLPRNHSLILDKCSFMPQSTSSALNKENCPTLKKHWRWSETKEEDIETNFWLIWFRDYEYIFEILIACVYVFFTDAVVLPRVASLLFILEGLDLNQRKNMYLK